MKMKEITPAKEIREILESCETLFDFASADEPRLIIKSKNMNTQRLMALFSLSGIPCENIRENECNPDEYMIALSPRSFYAIRMYSDGINPSNADELSDEQIAFRLYLFQIILQQRDM